MNAEERLAEATRWFLRVHADDAQEQDLARFKAWLEQHPDNAVCYQKVSSSWSAVGQFASTPELMMGRRDALEHARRASLSRWRGRFNMRPWYAAAASLVGVLGLVAVFWFSRVSDGDIYETGVAERRVLTMQDGSIVNLDASTRLKVRLDDESRSVTLETGQASFEVAKDPTRPFRVRASQHTIVALGTAFNVEVVRDRLLVTLIEGRVAVVAEERSQDAGDRSPVNSEESSTRASDMNGSAAIELTPGQQLVAVGNARTEIRDDVDLNRATAWQTGQLFFDDEPLGDAIARMNRYGSVRIVVDPKVADIRVSGIFRAGDIDAFTDAITSYFPVRIEATENRDIKLVPAR